MKIFSFPLSEKRERFSQIGLPDRSRYQKFTLLPRRENSRPGSENNKIRRMNERKISAPYILRECNLITRTQKEILWCMINGSCSRLESSLMIAMCVFLNELDSEHIVKIHLKDFSDPKNTRGNLNNLFSNEKRDIFLEKFMLFEWNNCE